MIINTQTFWSYIVDESIPMLNKVKELLTRQDLNYETKEYEKSELFQEVSKWDENVVLRIPTGIIPFLLEKLPLDVENKLSPLKRYTEFEVEDVCEEIREINPNFEIREYQIDAVLSSLNRFQSLIVASVGAGKTSMMGIVCKMLDTDRILIVNDTNFILQQIYDRLTSFGIEDVSWNKGETPDFSKRIVLFNTAGSHSKLASYNEEYIAYLKTINCFIIDEAQHVQSVTSFEPLLHTDEDKLTRIIGYSGSPFRNYNNPYNNTQDLITLAILSKPSFTYEMKDTISDENIAQPYSYFINYQNREANLPSHLKDNYYMQYRMNITYNKPRNVAGIEMLKFLNKNGIKTLASYNNIKPGQNMMKDLAEQGIKALFICGNNTIHEWIRNKRGTLKLETRKGDIEDVKQALNNGYNIIFGSSVMDEGVDIDVLQAVVLFSAGKTPIAGIQRIGRASRKKKNGMNASLVIDFKDINGHPVFRNQYEQRKDIMKKNGVKNIEKVHDFCKLVEDIRDSNNN